MYRNGSDFYILIGIVSCSSFYDCKLIGNYSTLLNVVLTTFCEVMGKILFVKSVPLAIGHPEDPRHGGY